AGMIGEIARTWAMLAMAALLEAGGDAAIRAGLRGPRWALFAGAAALVAYGFLVNLTRWDFSRMMGVYIAIFFLVSQLIAVFMLRERLTPPVLVGGALVIAGGLLMTFWQVPAK